MELVLLVAAAGDVVGEQPAGLREVVGVQVVAREQRDHREALHRHREVAADHQRQPVRLALE